MSPQAPQQHEVWHSADRFVIDQLIRPMVNLYRISAGPTPVAFVRQKRMAIKEDIRFYADENETDELFRIKARSLMEIGGRYDVTTSSGEKVGVLEKVFGKSLFRSTWRILDPSELEVAVAKERSMPIAIVRRVVDMVPYGDLVPIPFHFTIDSTEKHLGDLTRRLGHPRHVRPRPLGRLRAHDRSPPGDCPGHRPGCLQSR